MLRVAVLCNGSLAIPSTHLLIAKNSLAGIAVPLTFDPFPFEIEEIATKHRIPFFMIERADAAVSLENWIREISPDVVFVMLWPCKVPFTLLTIPRLGFFNWHPGLLPRYRGPDPIFWELRNQEPYGGITVHRMEESFDTGPVAYEGRVNILQTDTYADHYEKLIASATEATQFMLSCLPFVKLIPQDESVADYQGRPSPIDRTIDWQNQDAASILALIRASDVHGGAISYFRDSPIHIFRASFAPQISTIMEHGAIIATNPLTVQCHNKTAIHLEQVCADGQIFSDSKFCEDYKPQAGEQFSSSGVSGPEIPPS